MLIQRLDAFLTTQLVLQDTPNFFNSATNVAFSAIQHLIGQKKYVCLQGRITQPVQNVTSDSSLPASYFGTLKKVVVWIAAFSFMWFLTPVGVLTRYLSFRSEEVNQAYSLAYLLQIPAYEHTQPLIESTFAFLGKKSKTERNELLKELPLDLRISFLSLKTHQAYSNTFLLQMVELERTALLMKLPLDVQSAFLSLNSQHVYAISFLFKMNELERNELLMKLPDTVQSTYLQQKEEELKKAGKKKALDAHLSSAISFLSGLDQKSSLEAASSQPFYPYPFLFAEKLESSPDLRSLADTTLLARFKELHQSCCQQLEFTDPRQDETRQQKIQSESKTVLASTFKLNTKFFSDLHKILQNPAVPPSEIQEWLEKQKSPTYSYPFFTHPRVLELMQRLTTDPSKLAPLAITYSTCLERLKTKELKVEETPPDNAIGALVEAMDRLENIANLQSLIKTQ